MESWAKEQKMYEMKFAKSKFHHLKVRLRNRRGRIRRKVLPSADKVQAEAKLTCTINGSEQEAGLQIPMQIILII